MPGRRRLTTLLYAFPERTERCSFPTPSTPVLPFYSSPSSFFLRPPPSPPRLSLLSSLSLSFSPFYSLPFHFHTPPDVPLFPVHATLPRALSSISSTPLDCARLCCVLEERRNWKRKRIIYIYTLLFLFLLSLLFISTSYPVLSASIGTRLPKLHRLPLAHSLPSVPLLVFSAPPHNTRAIASYRIAGTSLSILPYI